MRNLADDNLFGGLRVKQRGNTKGNFAKIYLKSILMRKCTKFNFTPKQISELTISEAVYNEGGLLIELGQSFNVYSDFDKEMDRESFSSVLRGFVDRNDISIIRDSERALGLSKTTAYKVLNGDYVKDTTLLKLYSRILSCGELNLK